MRMTVSPVIWLSASFIGYYGAFGVFMPFLPVWMKAYDYPAETISLVFAISYLFRFLGSMLLSHSAKHPGLLISILRLIGGGSVLLISLLLLAPEYKWVAIPLIWLYTMVSGGAMPLGDALAGTWQKQVKLDYGKIRLTGSLSFIGASLLTGYLLGIWGERYAMWILFAYSIVYFIVQFLKPNPYPKTLEHSEHYSSQSVSYLTLLSDKKTLFVILILALIQGSHAAYYAYSVLYWTSQGIKLELTGILWGVAVAGEVMMFFFASRIFKNRSFYQILWLSTLVAMLRWGLTGLVSDFVLLVLLQTLHGITFAACHFATIRYFSTQPDKHIPKLQALYSGGSSCLGVAGLVVVAGWFYNMHPSWSFYAMALIQILTVFLLIRLYSQKASLI